MYNLEKQASGSITYDFDIEFTLEQTSTSVKVASK